MLSSLAVMNAVVEVNFFTGTAGVPPAASASKTSTVKGDATSGRDARAPSEELEWIKAY
jgi:hypothetical protein